MNGEDLSKEEEAKNRTVQGAKPHPGKSAIVLIVTMWICFLIGVSNAVHVSESYATIDMRAMTMYYVSAILAIIGLVLPRSEVGRDWLWPLRVSGGLLAIIHIVIFFGQHR